MRASIENKYDALEGKQKRMATKKRGRKKRQLFTGNMYKCWLDAFGEEEDRKVY